MCRQTPWCAKPPEQLPRSGGGGAGGDDDEAATTRTGNNEDRRTGNVARVITALRCAEVATAVS